MREYNFDHELSGETVNGPCSLLTNMNYDLPGNPTLINKGTHQSLQSVQTTMLPRLLNYNTLVTIKTR
jgi:hypothetical protein